MRYIIPLLLLLLPFGGASASEKDFQREQASAYVAMFIERLEQNKRLLDMAQATAPELFQNMQGKNIRPLIDSDIKRISDGLDGLIHPSEILPKPSKMMHLPN